MQYYVTRMSSRRASEQKGFRQQKRPYRQAYQFAVCLIVFLVMLCGKTAFPGKAVQLQDYVWEVLTHNTDLRDAFGKLGDAYSSGQSVSKRISEFCTEVFGPSSDSESNIQTVWNDITPDGSMERELKFLSTRPDPVQLSHHYMPAPVSSNNRPYTNREEAPAVSAGTIISRSAYSENELPEDCTMDYISLGNIETMTPVLGIVSSPYGYRTHPIEGTYKFHNGIDIAAEAGTPICAFADGTVEFIGEGDSFGQYIQLDHGNGIKSLYAHCSKLCASKGDQVFMGDQIALVGSTGDSTGPHLHLELKYRDTRLNPAYYIGTEGLP